MNKTELVKKVAAENNLSQKDAAAAVESVLDSIVVAPSPASTAMPAPAAILLPARKSRLPRATPLSSRLARLLKTRSTNLRIGMN